ncbi:hypothetical protein FACS189442_4220 [Spirochaetia bacterium]|nr:hypothetical protein FACS189442_4220 [Spirochaetia bacterium]
MVSLTQGANYFPYGVHVGFTLDPDYGREKEPYQPGGEAHTEHMLTGDKIDLSRKTASHKKRVKIGSVI